jgi:uroporphyrinogen-III synthase
MIVRLMSLRPLDGFVVGVTADRRWEEQAELLSRRGATVVHGPTITTLYLASDENLRAATVALIEDPPDFLVATTGIGIRAWLDTASTWGVSESLRVALSGTRIVARGPKAAAALQIGGLDVWACSPNEQMAALIDLLLAEPLAGRRLAFQEFGNESPMLVEALANAGATVVSVPVYRWRVPADPAPARRLVQAACQGELDAITFTSAPAVHNIFAIAESQRQADQLRAALNGPVTAACIGPVCAEGAREEGIADPLAPAVGRLGLLIRALGDHLSQRSRRFRLAGHDLIVQGGAIQLDGVDDQLSPQERAMFELLVRKPGAVVGRDTFLTRIWGSSATDPHLLDVAVARLRRRLGPAAPALQAFPGRGYRLDPDQPPA